MSKHRRLLHLAAGLACCAGPPACDFDCEHPDDLDGNQDAASLDPCPALPDGVDPIAGLLAARASERFDGLTLTLSTRPLACGESAAEHGYCGHDERGVTFGLTPEESTVGLHPVEYPMFVEFEAPDILSVNASGRFSSATLELYEITDACVTGRILGMADDGGPFDGGFRAPRCTP